MENKKVMKLKIWYNSNNVVNCESYILNEKYVCPSIRDNMLRVIDKDGVEIYFNNDKILKFVIYQEEDKGQ
jgi:hypothetical protein